MSVRWGTGIQICHLSPTKHLKHHSATPSPVSGSHRGQSQGSWGRDRSTCEALGWGSALRLWFQSGYTQPEAFPGLMQFCHGGVPRFTKPRVGKNSFKKIYKDTLTLSLEGFQELNLGSLPVNPHYHSNSGALPQTPCWNNRNEAPPTRILRETISEGGELCYRREFSQAGRTYFSGCFIYFAGADP